MSQAQRRGEKCGSRDYVVTHELAHLREMNHSPAFWEVVRTALPGFEQARGALRHEVLPLLDG